MRVNLNLNKDKLSSKPKNSFEISFTSNVLNQLRNKFQSSFLVRINLFVLDRNLEFKKMSEIGRNFLENNNKNIDIHSIPNRCKHNPKHSIVVTSISQKVSWP